MDYRNGDGSLSEMCGNGVRVFVHFLRAEGSYLPDGGRPTIGTRGGVKTLSGRTRATPWTWAPGSSSSRVRPPPRPWIRSSPPTASKYPGPAMSVSMGNPHTVVALAELSELEATRLFTAPHVDPTPPHGTNVEFVVPSEPLVHDGVGTITMRVHERGVGETQSCGTGACAAAVAIRHWAGQGAPDAWNVHVPGGVVGVKFLPGPEGARARRTQRAGRDRGWRDAFLTRRILKDFDVLSRVTVNGGPAPRPASAAGIGAEVLLHHEPRGSARRQPSESTAQQRVEAILSDPDGRVGPDRVKAEFRVHVSGMLAVTLPSPSEAAFSLVRVMQRSFTSTA